jgi:hypothetical protein
MGKLKIVPGKSANHSEIADDTGSKNSKKDGTGRRLEDTISSRGLKRILNLDRRVKRKERRGESDPNYKGITRRFTIDARANRKDPRDKD